MAASLEAAMSEFQLKVEELIVRGDVQFDASTTALREMRDAKEDPLARARWRRSWKTNRRSGARSRTRCARGRLLLTLVVGGDA